MAFVHYKDHTHLQTYYVAFECFVLEQKVKKENTRKADRACGFFLSPVILIIKITRERPEKLVKSIMPALLYSNKISGFIHLMQIKSFCSLFDLNQTNFFYFCFIKTLQCMLITSCPKLNKQSDAYLTNWYMHSHKHT